MKKWMGIMIMLLTTTLTGCRLTISMTGSNIHPEAKTVFIGTFVNNASLVNPSLSQDFTNALKNLVQNQTPLTIIDSPNADYRLEGEISGYSVNPVAIRGDDTPAMNRLTVTVRVKFQNRFNENENFEQSFSRYVDFSSSLNFTSVERNLVEEINVALTEDIFNKAFVNW